MAQTTMLGKPRVVNVYENLFCPFSFVRRHPDGRFVREGKPLLHFGNIDSGAMVRCVSQIMLDVFPELNQYKHDAPDVMYGVGNMKCRVFGQLMDVPVSLGPLQEPGTVVLANFKIVEGDTYAVLFGLDLLDPICAKICVHEKMLEYRGAPLATAQSVLPRKRYVSLY